MEERKRALQIEQDRQGQAQREERERLKLQQWIYEKKNVIPIVKADKTYFDPNEFLDDFSDKSESGDILGVKKLKTRPFEIRSPTYSSNRK